ncbi:MAG: helix-turn-helix domain-containing protein [Candidatus Neomarinimicrobiota bacterium]|jgi:hypothetical protein
MPEESDDVLRVAALVAQEMHVKTSDLFSSKKSKSVVLARQMLAYLLREQGCSYPEIAEKMGYKDHTSPMNSVAVFKKKRGDAQVEAHLHDVVVALNNCSAPTVTRQGTLVRVTLPTAVLLRLRHLLSSGCYGDTIPEVLQRLVGDAAYQLVPSLIATSKE